MPLSLYVNDTIHQLACENPSQLEYPGATFIRCGVSNPGPSKCHSCGSVWRRRNSEKNVRMNRWKIHFLCPLPNVSSSMYAFHGQKRLTHGKGELSTQPLSCAVLDAGTCKKPCALLRFAGPERLERALGGATHCAFRVCACVCELLENTISPLFRALRWFVPEPELSSAYEPAVGPGARSCPGWIDASASPSQARAVQSVDFRRPSWEQWQPPSFV